MNLKKWSLIIKHLRILRFMGRIAGVPACLLGVLEAQQWPIAANGHRGGGLHSIALSGRANAYAFLAVLSPPPLLPTHRPASLV
jgi:hypothetical protein